MRYTGRSRLAVAAVLSAITLALTTGCSVSVGDVKKKEPTADEKPADEKPADEKPADEKPADGSSTAPGNTGVGEGGAVHRTRVAQTISDKLVETRGQRPDRVTCPAHLPARVGATIRCELTAGSDTLGVTVTALSVTDNKVNFDFKVDDAVG